MGAAVVLLSEMIYSLTQAGGGYQGENFASANSSASIGFSAVDDSFLGSSIIDSPVAAPAWNEQVFFPGGVATESNVEIFVPEAPELAPETVPTSEPLWSNVITTLPVEAQAVFLTETADGLDDGKCWEKDKKQNANQKALRDLAKEAEKSAKNGDPISEEEAKVLDEWADEYEVPQHHKTLSGSGRHFKGGNNSDHTHIYNIHVPYQ